MEGVDYGDMEILYRVRNRQFNLNQGGNSGKDLDVMTKQKSGGESKSDVRVVAEKAGVVQVDSWDN